MIADRRTWPAIPAVLLATLLLALGLSGSWGQTPITAVGSPTPTERSSATPRATTAGTPATAAPSAAPPTAAPSATPETTPRPTPAPTAAPTYTTYRVQSGDTLSGIATRFHTTVKAISALNGISSTTTLHIGQILKVPKS